MIKVLSLFSGIGAFEKALKRQNIKFELVNYCDIDKYASKSYSIIHNEPESKNLGDVTKVNEKELPDFDLMTWGSPCQDFSVSGRGEGSIWKCQNCKVTYNPLYVHFLNRNKCPECGCMKIEKTRSSLLVEGLRILQYKKPIYSIYENVKNITGKKHKETFELFIKEMQEYGYNNYYQVLNAKNHGIPQNRERVYIISIRKDMDDCTFEFPKPFDNGLRLKDFLEDKVDKKYYLPKEKVEKLIATLNNKNIMNAAAIQQNHEKLKIKEDEICSCIDANYWKGLDNHASRTGIMERNDTVCVGRVEIKGHDYLKRVYSVEGCSPTIPTCCGGNHEPKILEPVICASRGRNPDNPSDRTTGSSTEQRLEVNTNGCSNTLTSVQKDNYVLEPEYKIRKLTPRCYWRLMGFNDEDINKCIKAGISNTQLYKQAGNSIVVNVLEEIFKQLLIHNENIIKEKEMVLV